jgi:hypothetical protein
MRRPKSTAIIQVNLRFDADLVARLETAAKDRATTLAQETRERLIASFAERSLFDLVDDFKRRARHAVEHSARKEDIEKAWNCLRTLDSLSNKFYADAEQTLSVYVHSPEVRTLLRGPEHKPSQQERGAGGKK